MIETPAVNSQTAPTNTSLHKIAYINILRGIAVLAVLLVHVSNDFVIKSLPITLADLVKDGRYGVQLFFFASAFTIFYSHANRRNELHAERNFFIRRFFRIAPLYYLALIYYLFQNGTGPSFNNGGVHSITIMGIIENLFFIHGVDPYHINSVVPGGWSITVEMSFYCLVPFLFRIIKNTNSALYFLITTILIREVFNLFMAHFVSRYIPESYLFDLFTYYYLPNQLPVFAIGILFYFLVQNKTGVSATPLLIIFSLTLIELLTKRLNITEHITLSLSFILLALALSKSKITGWFPNVIQYIGTISYSMYLVHFGIIYFLLKLPFIPGPNGRLNNLLYFSIEYLAVVLLTVVVASITYKYIEVPAQGIGKKFIEKLSKS